MNARELDEAYTSMCEAIARVGEDKATLFLAMLSLSLIARHTSVDEVNSLLAQAERACAHAAPPVGITGEARPNP